jgi:hypothetical protein
MPILATLSSWLVSIAGSVAASALLSIGFGIVSFAGLTTLIDSMIDDAQTSYSSLPASILQLAGLLGVPDAFGIIAFGVTTRVSMFALKQLRLK